MAMKQKRAEKLFCYYCDREFDHENFLVAHQRANHFTCLACHKNFFMAGGLVDHIFCAHNETITEVPNAIPGRESTKIEIYGMHGIPPDVLVAHNYGKGNPANGNSPMYASGPTIEAPSIEPRPVISNQDPAAQLEVNEKFSSNNLDSPANINSHMYASGPNIGAPSVGPLPVITNQDPADGVRVQ